MDMKCYSEKFFNGKRILITGHTGFKGSWLSILLNQLGAQVYGYATDPPTQPSLFELAKIEALISSTIGDIRDFDFLLKTYHSSKPEIIIHMAAQPLVRESYVNPRETYEINVMGTVNVLEAARRTDSVRAILIVTTDKCYENREWPWAYRENDVLGGYDPYSNSKACSELVTSAYRNSFFNIKEYDKHGIAVASARAGNVIGGGDWAADRLLPDFFRAIIQGENVSIRSPHAIRPWQHVLEPLTGYLALCEKLYTNGPKYAESWNFGADEADAKSVEWMIRQICELWGENASYEIDRSPQPHEATYLRLDCSKAKSHLGWKQAWSIERALEKTVEWTKAYLEKKDLRRICFDQINEYYNSRGNSSALV
jgi:CDP-glucose 4,6-dehydratase